MPGDQFDFINAIDVKVGLGFDLCRRVFRDDALCSKRFCYSQFHIEPTLVSVLVFPDLAHSRAGIARYHPREFSRAELVLSAPADASSRRLLSVPDISARVAIPVEQSQGDCSFH